MKKKTITLMFDPKKKLQKVSFMNTLASVVQIMHTDPEVGYLDIQIYDKAKLKESFKITVI